LFDEPLLPDYAGPCVCNVMPALLEPLDELPAWMPREAGADQIVLLVLDGLGWEQLQARPSLASNLLGMGGGPITTIAPTTTSTALTSITTGLAPGEHGVIGYRIAVDSQVLNVLRWTIDSRDARERVPPEKVQTHQAFLGHHPAVVTRAEFRTTGFTTAHLDPVRFHGYRVVSTLVTEVVRLARSGEPFVYAYYDGIDKVSHEYGLSGHYDAELFSVDQMVGYLLSALPAGTTLLVTADHGQVDVGKNMIQLDSDVMAQVALQSGEGRFRWLHARPGRTRELYDAAVAHHADRGWVVTQEQTIDEGWFGPTVTDAARSRLGDVALVARDDVAYHDPADSGIYDLLGRHGSLTPAEIYVPLLARSV
jgi:predicted AlkP superfamily pyrophosphatase or phosphodiesterase